MRRTSCPKSWHSDPPLADAFERKGALCFIWASICDHENYIVQMTNHRHIEGLSWKRQHDTLTSIPLVLERLSHWAIVNFPNATEFNCGSDVNGRKSYNDGGLWVVFEEQQSFPCEEKEQDVRDADEIVHGHGCERCLGGYRWHIMATIIVDECDPAHDGDRKDENGID